MIAAMAKDKEKSLSKLTFMDPPIGPETQPKPKPKPVKSGAAKLGIPPPVSPPSDVSDMPWGCLQFCLAAVSQKLLPYNIIAF